MTMPFFHQYSQQELSYEALIPNKNTNPEIAKRAVYAPFIKKLAHYCGMKQKELDLALITYRQLATKGALEALDFQKMQTHFQELKRDILEEEPNLSGWKQVCRYKMFFGQILFLDNCIKEGIQSLLPQESWAQLVDDIKSYLTENGCLDPETQKFHASVFISQALFDQLFVAKGPVLTPNPNTGHLEPHANYESQTLYLEIPNAMVVNASDELRQLCYILTTGWGEGLTSKIHNQLNHWYYSREHLFSEHYDDILEAMLPQFAWSKLKTARALVKRHQRVHIIEIGAGSGSFAADLYRAIQEHAYHTDHYRYTGIEPGLGMSQTFIDNFQNRVGKALPKDWILCEETSMEDFHQQPENYVDPDWTTVLVFSFSAHHCYGPNVDAFLNDQNLQKMVSHIYILEGLAQHGMYKMFYMWTDVESPEDFENVSKSGIWRSKTLWQEPFIPMDHHCLTRAWCSLRELTH